MDPSSRASLRAGEAGDYWLLGRQTGLMTGCCPAKQAGNSERFFKLPKVTQLMHSEETGLGWVGCLSCTQRRGCGHSDQSLATLCLLLLPFIASRTSGGLLCPQLLSWAKFRVSALKAAAQPPWWFRTSHCFSFPVQDVGGLGEAGKAWHCSRKPFQ